jgi:hypothetical protein
MNPLRKIHGQTAGLVLALGVALAAGAAQPATLELTGPPGTMVSLNDRVVGALPFDGPLDLPPGRYTIRCGLPGHVPFEQKIRLVAPDAWQRVTVRLVPYSRRTAWTSNILLAGLGQHYLGFGFRGYVYNVAEIGGLLAALGGELQRSNLESDYLKLVDDYNQAVDATEIARLRELAETKHQDMKDMESLRNTGLIVAGGAILVSIADALLAFPAVAAGSGPVPVDTGALDGPWSDPGGASALHAGLRLGF